MPPPSGNVRSSKTAATSPLRNPSPIPLESSRTHWSLPFVVVGFTVFGFELDIRIKFCKVRYLAWAFFAASAAMKRSICSFN